MSDYICSRDGIEGYFPGETTFELALKMEISVL
jgi:hypothetical protein